MHRYNRRRSPRRKFHKSLFQTHSLRFWNVLTQYSFDSFRPQKHRPLIRQCALERGQKGVPPIRYRWRPSRLGGKRSGKKNQCMGIKRAITERWASGAAIHRQRPERYAVWWRLACTCERCRSAGCGSFSCATRRYLSTPGGCFSWQFRWPKKSPHPGMRAFLGCSTETCSAAPAEQR